jgi:FlaA1/EpsC-like NDP-sugar epimerase
MVISLLSLPRYGKRIFVVFLDISLCVISVWLAYYLRLGVFVAPTKSVLLVMFSSILIAMPIFLVSGLYKEIFRYSGLPAMIAVSRAVLIYGLLFSTVINFRIIEGVPRTVGLIQPVLLMLLVGGSRVGAQVCFGASKRKPRKSNLPKTLIYGAGEAGRQLASAMEDSEIMCVVGFIDDDLRLEGNILNGLPIYSPDSILELIRTESISDVLLAVPSISRQRRNDIIKMLKTHKLVVRTLPALSDIAMGKVKVSDIIDLDIEDLLGREAVNPNEQLLNHNIRGKTVLITGAGGSIGGEMCRQILRLKPRRLLLVEMCEYALYQIHQELQALSACDHDVLCAFESDEKNRYGDGLSKGELIMSPSIIVPLLASVCDEARMHIIMETWRPHTVYHAAAYKHVPIVEQNPIEGVRNNIWGTRVCAEVALRNSVSNFVLISTDKAVRPTNIMGATKRMAEMVLQALADVQFKSGEESESLRKGHTIFSMVRFGNVLGSSGSVVPIFRDQISKGGPITLTHPEITRYFMTIPEAAQLVIQAGAMGEGGDVFVLDMGKPVKIIDLARRIVELSGMTVRNEANPDGDIEIINTGLRPGEKLYEELLIGDNPQVTRHPRIMKALEQHLSWAQLKQRLDEIYDAMNRNDVECIRLLLKQTVNGYQANSAVVDLVSVARAGVM